MSAHRCFTEFIKQANMFNELVYHIHFFATSLIILVIQEHEY